MNLTPAQRTIHAAAVLQAPPSAQPEGPVPPKAKVVDYDINQAPPVIKLLVDGVREMDVEEVKAEAMNLWPREFPVRIPDGFPTPDPSERGGYFLPDDIARARRKLTGAVVGVALGVTKLEAHPQSVVVQAALALDSDVGARQMRERNQKKAAAAIKAARTEQARKAARAARKARKR